METPRVDADTPTPTQNRKPYTAPRLTCYGDLAELTQYLAGGGTDAFDYGSQLH
jgi:hypothetical protein